MFERLMSTTLSVLGIKIKIALTCSGGVGGEGGGGGGGGGEQSWAIACTTSNIVNLVLFTLYFLAPLSRRLWGSL